MVALVVALVLAPAPVGDRPAPVRAADAIAADGTYVAPSADVDAARLRVIADEHPGFGFVVLSAEAPAGAEEFADDVLDATATAAPSVHTVVVVSPTDYGAKSERYGDAAIDGAFADSVDGLRTDRVGGLDAFADRVPFAGPTLAQEDAEDVGEGGSSFPIGWVLLIGAIVGVAVLSQWMGWTGTGGGGGSTWSSGSSTRRRSFGSFGGSGRSSSSSRSSSRSSSSRRGGGGGRF